MTDTARTRYSGPTDTRGARIIVTFEGHSHAVPRDYAASNAHEAAALTVVRRYRPGASVAYVRETRSGRGNVYVVA